MLGCIGGGRVGGWGRVVLGFAQTDVEKAVDALRGMTGSFKKRKWDPIQFKPKEFIVEFPNENALHHLLSQSSWLYCGEK